MYKQLFSFVLLSVLCLLCLQIGLSHAQEQQRIAILELKNQAPNKIGKGKVEYLSNEIRRITGYLPVSRYLVMTKENMEQMMADALAIAMCHVEGKGSLVRMVSRLINLHCHRHCSDFDDSEPDTYL